MVGRTKYRKRGSYDPHGTSQLLRRVNIRTILKSKFQFLAVILITAISMMLFVGLTSNSVSFENRVNQLYNGSNMADLFLTTTLVQDGDLEAVNNAIGANGQSEQRLSLNGKIANFYGKAYVSDEIPKICGPYESNNQDTENFFIIDKRLVEEKRSTFVDGNKYKTVPVSFSFTNYSKILKDTQIREFLPAGIGSLITTDATIMDVLNLCVKEGKQNIFDQPFINLNFKVSGHMLFAENVQNSVLNETTYLLSRNYLKHEFLGSFLDNFQAPTPDPASPYYAFQLILALGGFQAIVDNITSLFDMNNQIVSKVGDKPIQSCISEINDYFDSKDVNNLIMLADVDHLPSNITVQNDIAQASTLAYVFPMIFFLIATLVVLTTISQIIVKDRITIGTLKGLGISKGRIIWHYISLALILVTFGALIGMVFGPMILMMVMNQKYSMLYTLPRLVLTTSFPHLLLAFIMLYGMTILVTYIVCNREAKLKPALSMRPKVVEGLKAKKRGVATKHPFLISVKMAFRNIRLNIAKSLMVIVGIMGCTSLLVCGFGINDTINYGVDLDMKMFYGSDITLQYDSVVSLKKEIEQVEGVKKVVEYANLPATVNYISDVNGIQEEATYQSIGFLLNDECQIFYEDKGITIGEDVVISTKVASALKLKEGDPIYFNIIGSSYESTVGKVVETFSSHGIFINTDKEPFALLKTMKNKAWVETIEGYDVEKIASDIAKINGVVVSASHQKSLDKNNEYMSGVYLMTTAIIIFALSLAVVVLYNLVLLNYKERIRDIATLKVLGFSRREIGESLILETMVLCIIGIGLGLLLGLPMEMLVLTINTTPLIEFIWYVSPMTYGISFLVTFGTGLLVNLFLARKIKTIPMVESLKSVD